MFELRQFLVGGLVVLPLEETVKQIRQGVERGILVIRDASTFPAHLRLVGHMVFEHLHEAALSETSVSAQEYHLPLSTLGLLPTFQQKRDFRFATDQRCQSSWLRHLQATSDTTLTQDVVEVH